MAAPIAWTTTASRFPELFRDRRWVQEIAFEEFRLRRQAGEDPSPLEYRRRFGADTLDWPSSFLDSLEGDSGEHASAPGDLEARGDAVAGDVATAATAYREYRDGRGDDPARLEAALRVAGRLAGTGRAVPGPRPVGLEPGGPPGAGRDGLPARWGARSSASGSSPSWAAGPSAASTWPARGTSPTGPSR